MLIRRAGAPEFRAQAVTGCDSPKYFAALSAATALRTGSAIATSSMNAPASRAAQPLIELQPVSGAGAAGEAANQAKALLPNGPK